MESWCPVTPWIDLVFMGFVGIVRGLAPETQVGLSRFSVTIKLCDSYCLGIDLEELIARRLSSCAMGGVRVYTIVGFG